MVLYYKANHTDLYDQTKEEMEEGKKETKEETKQESWEEVASQASDPAEVKSTEDKEGAYGESQEQGGKEEDNKDESDDACPEASEENSRLKLSENKKVTAVQDWIRWEVGCRAQVPEDGLLQEEKPASPEAWRSGTVEMSREWWRRSLRGRWQA